jgi:hypothetical protein
VLVWVEVETEPWLVLSLLEGTLIGVVYVMTVVE